MAVVNKNSGKILRFEDAGRVLITPDGSVDDFNILNILEGTVNIESGGREALEPDMDRGQLLADIREGNEVPSKITLNIKFTADVTADALYNLLKALGTDGYKPKFTVVVEIYDFSGGTGQKFTMTNAVAGANPTVAAGAKEDTMQVSFIGPDQILLAAV